MDQANRKVSTPSSYRKKMGCKPSKETLQSAPHDGRQSAIKSSPVDVISDHDEKLVSLKGDDETAQNDEPLTNQEIEEEEQAAIKIQAAFKGYKVRKTMAAEPSKAELEAEFRADDKELCHAATKIQASFRGHQARAQMAPNAKVEELSKDMQKLNPAADEPEAEEELDIDLSDPDLHKAATKIQASFRGHKVRKDDK